MKKSRLFKILILLILSSAMIFFAGCRGEYKNSTDIIVQLEYGGANYPVDGMTVYIQKGSGPVLTGVTGADGKTTINVNEFGNYSVIQVTGLDASTFAEGDDTGREFVKTNPLANPYPYIIYNFGGIYPVINVPDFDNTYAINVTVPLINKVTVLKVGSVVSDDSGSNTVSAGNADFAGRVMISNLSASDEYFSMGVWSNDANFNRLVLYADATTWTGGAFYGGPSDTSNAIGLNASYTQAGPVYFEAPGTNSGDWALGCNLLTTGLVTRAGLGGADETRNFPMFIGGSAGNVIRITSSIGGSGHTYRFEYRIFQFSEY